MPQGSILGPLLFKLYMFPLTKVLQSCNVSYHMHVDDTFESSNDSCIKNTLKQCIKHISKWITEKFLHFSNNKTGYFWRTENFKISADLRSLSLNKSQVWNIGVTLDRDLNFKNRIKSMIKIMFLLSYNYRKTHRLHFKT